MESCDLVHVCVFVSVSQDQPLFSFWPKRGQAPAKAADIQFDVQETQLWLFTRGGVCACVRAFVYMCMLRYAKDNVDRMR